MFYLAATPHLAMSSPSDRVRIVLTVPQVEQLAEVAHGFNEKPMYKGKPLYNPTGNTTTDGVDAHLMGLVTECAVANLLDLNFEPVHFETHGDGGTDIHIPNLGTAQVKATSYAINPMLRVPVSQIQKTPCDLYFLTHIDMKNPYVVDICGFATFDMIASTTPKRLTPRGPMNHILTEKQLLSILDFFTLQDDL